MSDLRVRAIARSVDSCELRPWQQEIVNLISVHEEFRESEQYQGLSEYAINKSLGMLVALPKHSGHTFLANYIASQYPSLLIYSTMDHYRAVTDRFPLHPGTETISLYEMFYAVYKPTKHQPSPEFMELRKKFANKQVVVVDNALSMLSDMQDLIYNNATGSVVLLGQ